MSRTTPLPGSSARSHDEPCGRWPPDAQLAARCDRRAFLQGTGVGLGAILAANYGCSGGGGTTTSPGPQPTPVPSVVTRGIVSGTTGALLRGTFIYTNGSSGQQETVSTDGGLVSLMNPTGTIQIAGVPGHYDRTAPVDDLVYVDGGEAFMVVPSGNGKLDERLRVAMQGGLIRLPGPYRRGESPLALTVQYLATNDNLAAAIGSALSVLPDVSEGVFGLPMAQRVSSQDEFRQSAGFINVYPTSRNWATPRYQDNLINGATVEYADLNPTVLEGRMRHEIGYHVVCQPRDLHPSSGIGGLSTMRVDNDDRAVVQVLLRACPGATHREYGLS